MKPVIGITMQHDLERDILFQQSAYIDAVADCGGIPLSVPPSDINFSSEITKRADGFIFTGGGDIDPTVYGKGISGEAMNISKKRDLPELELFRECVKNNIPSLGICRGIQIMNVAMGGDLIPHTPFHSAEYKEGKSVHLVLVKGKYFAVNSSHHQVLGYIPPCFEVFARDLKNDVEGIYMPGKNFIAGVQWHPEKNYKYNSFSRHIIKAFIDSCV